MTNEYDVMPLATDVTTATVTYHLTNCSGASSNPTSSTTLLVSVTLTANAGYMIRNSDVKVVGGTLDSIDNTSGSTYTLSISRGATVANVDITVVASAVKAQFLDEAGVRQFATKTKAYIDSRARITNVVVGTDVIDITIA